MPVLANFFPLPAVLIAMSSFFLISCGGPRKFKFQKNACHFRVDRGHTVKWNNLPVTIYTQSSMSDPEVQNLAYAVDIWNQAWDNETKQGRLFDLVGDININLEESYNDEVNVTFSIVNLEESKMKPNEQGKTIILNKYGGSIYDTDILINKSNFEYYIEGEEYEEELLAQRRNFHSSERVLASSVNQGVWQALTNTLTGMWGWLAFWSRKAKNRRLSSVEKEIPKNQVDLISLYIHELGHSAGLVHIERFERKSIRTGPMNPYLRRGEVRRKIQEEELSSLACTYSI